MVVTMGMFCAVAFVVTLLSKLIPINIAGFLTFDLKDVILVICGFIYGPVPAIIVTAVVSVIEMLTVSATGPIGLLMNVLSSCAFVVPAAIIYRAKRKMSGAVMGILAGILGMTVIMLLWNWLITPLYMGVDRSVVVAMLIPVFLPFNLIKGGINAAVAILIYKPSVTALRRARLLSVSDKASVSAKENNRGKITLIAAITAAFVLVSLILVVLVWTKVI